MSASHENVPLHTKFKANKDDLISLVSKCQQRNFAEEVDFLEQLGGFFKAFVYKIDLFIGDQAFTDLLGVDYYKGIDAKEVEDRRHQYGTAKVEDTPPDGQKSSLRQHANMF